MNSTNANKLFLILGITVFLTGALMTISHIKYGAGMMLAGIVLLGLRLIPPILRNMFHGKNDNQYTNYPNISHSFKITGIVILSMLLLSPVNFMLNSIIGKEASMLIYYLMAIGFPLTILYSSRKAKLNISLENKRIIPYLIIGSVAMIFGIASPIVASIPVPEFIQRVLLESGTQTGILTFILMVIAAPVMEELIFRGIILDGLLKNYSPLKSILISSLLFGICHLNPWQFITALMIGIFSGWVYLNTRSLLPSIIIHASVNLSAFSMRFFLDADSIKDESVIEMYGGLSNLILAIFGSILIISTCVYYLRKEFTNYPLRINGIAGEINNSQ